ncbi:MAG: tRNA (adenosine(37)-N6)-dimethylallyltransferase MiaA [Verrucomicrobiota bacterium]
MKSFGKIYALSGCTAVGKTELSLRWAEANDAEIVSCDSLLFYKGMDIGTAKPTVEERKRVTHHLIDVLEPSEQMDIARYIELAIETIREIQDRGKKVLVTGGSGFYLKAFFSPVVDDVVVSEEIRSEVGRLFDHGGLEGCVAALLKWEPGAHEILDTQNSRRVLRALERCMASGKSVSALRTEFEAKTNLLIDAPKQLTVLEREKEELNDRIELRVKLMIEDGLIEEVELLRNRGFERNTSALASIGYRETLAYLNGDIDRDEMIEKICVNTRRLAKKQRTWFRSQTPDHKKINLSVIEKVNTDELFSQ